MRRVHLLGAGVLAACCAVVLSLPPARQTLSSRTAFGAPPLVRGVVHVHSTRSDGTGSVEAIAAAAARAGLQFVVVTDHGDGHESPALPRYLSGVLCIDGVEVSTDEGHVLALGLGRAPYKLAGDAAGTVEDIGRFGGFSIVAHADSAKPELRWTDRTLPFDGIEWLNGDSEWRDEGSVGLLRALATYWLRGPEALASLLDRPTILRDWDTMTRVRAVVGLAGSDAHARLGVRAIGEPYDRGLSFALPDYAQMFQTFSLTLEGVGLSGDARTDAQRVLTAIRKGHLFSTIDAAATPGHLMFAASSGPHTARMGESLQLAGAVTLSIETNAPPAATIQIIKDGIVVQRSPAPTATRTESPAPATYRVEVEIPGAPGTPPVPWIVSNPIYVAPPPGARVATAVASSTATALYRDGLASGWTVEKSVRSSGALDVVPAVGRTQLSFRFALAGAGSESPFVALAVPVTGGIAGFSGIRLLARASQAMRVSVQVRVPNGANSQRWRRSVFLNDTAREVVVPFLTMQSADVRPSVTIPLDDVRTILIVIDGVHTPLGTSGRLWIEQIGLVRDVASGAGDALSAPPTSAP